MFKDLIQSIYEKVYIINFEKCSQTPCLTNEELKSLGKWYVSTGKEWICHSDYELEEFKNIFLNFINPEEWDNISFDSDFMPFQQS
ncbi:DUF3884 family protein [Streptococcus mitis]|uniref:DUF3884 family protein n=1 Tax=Streptococcus mitis TaxID=28037 RepID=UPI001EDE6966|nr:DUF3884 family protein [Streptococcus mitis]MCG4864519.1 DUF3884 family protein [Streptococcus mitis]